MTKQERITYMENIIIYTERYIENSKSQKELEDHTAKKVKFVKMLNELKKA